MNQSLFVMCKNGGAEPLPCKDFIWGWWKFLISQKQCFFSKISFHVWSTIAYLRFSLHFRSLWVHSHTTSPVIHSVTFLRFILKHGLHSAIINTRNHEFSHALCIQSIDTTLCQFSLPISRLVLKHACKSEKHSINYLNNSFDYYTSVLILPWRHKMQHTHTHTSPPPHTHTVDELTHVLFWLGQ